MYFSQNAMALFNAGLLYGLSRLCAPKDEELSRDRIEDLARIRNIRKVYEIDVTAMKEPHKAGGMKGYRYWYATPWVNNDILPLFKLQLPPDRRGCSGQRDMGRSILFLYNIRSAPCARWKRL